METEEYVLHDNGSFPNSVYPVMHYKKAFRLPLFGAARFLGKQFTLYGWTGIVKDASFPLHHYHSSSHKALGVYKGRALILLGGENGKQVLLRKGDVLLIPAGVAHRHLGREKEMRHVAGYSQGNRFDLQFGFSGERPGTDSNIASVPTPEADPVLGSAAGVAVRWRPQI